MNSVEKARQEYREKAKELFKATDFISSTGSMLVMSHMSDADMIKTQDPKQATIHINFAKFIISRLCADLTYEVDANKLWAEFHKKFNHLINS